MLSLYERVLFKRRHGRSPNLSEINKGDVMENKAGLLSDPLNEPEAYIRNGIRAATAHCFARSYDAGWWFDPTTKMDHRTNPMCVPLKIALIHSELSEGLEGARKNKMDDHLPDRPSLEVELADALIRIFDLAGGLDLDLAGAVIEKLRYNAIRPDHKPGARAASDGKVY